MYPPPLPVHRAIALVDVEGFGDPQRTTVHHTSLRADLYDIVKQAFGDARIPWSKCYHEDRGDGIMILVPASVPKRLLADSLPLSLVKEVRRHNAARPAKGRMRVRLALHAGELAFDTHGVTGPALNFAFRLLEAPPLKHALATSPGLLALITSNWFFDEVVRQSPASELNSYWQVPVAVKETSTTAWICLPDHPYATNHQRLADDQEPAPNNPLQAFGIPNEPQQLAIVLDDRAHVVLIIARAPRFRHQRRRRTDDPPGVDIGLVRLAPTGSRMSLVGAVHRRLNGRDGRASPVSRLVVEPPGNNLREALSVVNLVRETAGGVPNPTVGTGPIREHRRASWWAYALRYGSAIGLVTAVLVVACWYLTV